MDINTSRLRVTYYARACSDPVLPFDLQDFCHVEYESFVSRHPSWLYIPGYIDEPNPSDNTNSMCANFNRMMVDAAEGKFDLILTDAICNFAKDIPESIRCVRRLLNHGVDILFLEDICNAQDEYAALWQSIQHITALE